jgi:thymidine phosphorylase
MNTRDDAVRLARSLVAVGRAAGVRTEALVTQMDAPLGRAVGNALEVIEAIETLKGRGPADLERLSIALAARMLCLAGLAASDDEAARRLRSALASGAGLEKFAQIVERQGGDAGVVDDYDRLPRAPPRAVVRAPCAGYVSALDAERVGRAAVLLGAGRGTIEDAVDPAAGIVVCRTRGERVDEGDAIAELHARDTSRLGEAMALVEKGLVITGERMGEQPLVVDVVS